MRESRSWKDSFQRLRASSSMTHPEGRGLRARGRAGGRKTRSRRRPLVVRELADARDVGGLPPCLDRAVAEQLAPGNEEAREHGEAAIGWLDYIVTAEFWERTLQNWQSEFLAVGTMAVFTIYLRQRGSPESKPVGAPHDETASSG